MVVDPRSHRIGGPADQWAEQGGDGHESYSQAVEELGAGVVGLGEEDREHADLRHGKPGYRAARQRLSRRPILCATV